MEIQVLGAHNCESEGTKLVSLLVDDVLAIDAGGLTSALSFERQQKLEAILLTHQHYDHIRDVPAIAMSLYLRSRTVNICSTQVVYDALLSHLMNGELYPNFLERPEANPTLTFTIMEPYKPERIGGYSILAVPVKHQVPTVGYQITSPDGKIVFCTGDTGPGLADCWRQVSPQLLVIDVTAPNRLEEFGRSSGHLTPRLLQRELVDFREIRGYLPQVVLVHMNPNLEGEIAEEAAAVARALGGSITLAHEGMRLCL